LQEALDKVADKIWRSSKVHSGIAEPVDMH
jgi:hypothetical protein